MLPCFDFFKVIVSICLGLISIGLVFVQYNSFVRKKKFCEQRFANVHFSSETVMIYVIFFKS